MTRYLNEICQTEAVKPIVHMYTQNGPHLETYN